MSARENLFGFVEAGAEEADLPTFAAAVDDYRTEALAKAIGRLRAVPVNCTALTGPTWYGTGWNSAITTLEEIADYQKPDDEAYPGELQRLRALALAIRAALRKPSLTEAKRVMRAHVEWEEEATADIVPDFFQPDHSYTHRDGSTFRCVAVTTHPDGGERVALGWHTDTADWTFVGVRNIDHWNHEYDGVQPPAEAGEAPAPQHYDKVPDPLDGCHWCACGNRWPCKDAAAVTG